MSLTSYRAAPPRVTSLLSLWDFPKSGSQQDQMHRKA